MKLTVSNANITNTISSARMTLGNSSIVESLTLGNVSITPSQIAVGNVSITPAAVSVPTLVLGGSQFSGGGIQQGGIINYQEFTANGTWINPLTIIRQQTSVSQGLTYSYYIQGSSTNPATEAGLDALFNTATASPTVAFGGTGIHSGTINWGDSGQTGAGGAVGTKPAYLPANTYSWMVEGYIRAPETGTYFFGVDGDDALDVFVNGVNVANWYGGHGFSATWSGNTSGSGQNSGSISLVANTYYSFRARMQEGLGGDGIQVGWRKPSDGAIGLIPANAFFYGTVANSVNTLTGYEQVLVMAWGGGGGAASNNTIAKGGGGGSCVIGNYTLSFLPNTVSVNVGSGGAASRTTTTTIGTGGGAGGNTIFGSLVAYGGAGTTDGTGPGGGGGGTLGVGVASGSSATGGVPLGGATGTATVAGGTSTFGGGGGANTISIRGGDSVFGGGGGAYGGSGSGVGGNSVYGGAGGSVGTSGASSIFGGNGGFNGSAGSIPGGGGSSNTSSANTGARGEVRVWVFGPAGTTAGAPTYALTANTTTLYEGSSVLYTVSTTNIANGTTFYYTLNNSSTAVATDFTTAVNGSVVINGGTGTFTLTANNDTDSANEAFQIDVRTGSTTGSIVASNGNVSIIPLVEVEYLVIAGGGSGAGEVSAGAGTGGGGAGGYRSSVSGENSGGGASAETVFIAFAGVAYTITVGAGGTGPSGRVNGTDGSNSVFATITSRGGGGGGTYNNDGRAGGSGGGGAWAASSSAGGAGTANQGYNGGGGLLENTPGGGGGGAGEVGNADAVGFGGDGVSSSITGTAVTRAGGGAGGTYTSTTRRTGGLGGGGDGGSTSSALRNGLSGGVNTGGGGGGGSGASGTASGGNGGSGVVILKIPVDQTATFSAGVTQTSATVGSFKVYTITAAGLTDTVTIT